MAENETPVEEADLGKIEILISEGEFSYNTNMPVPEMLFWLRVVGDFAVERVLTADDTE